MAKRNENNRKIKLFLFHLRTRSQEEDGNRGGQGVAADAATLVDSIPNTQALHIAYIQRQARTKRNEGQHGRVKKYNPGA